MSAKHILYLLVLVFLFTSACAHVDYIRMSAKESESPPDSIKSNYGIPFYEPKPFILVTHSVDANGKPVSTTTLISLPDKSRPYRAKLTPGLGATDVSVTLSNGVLVTTSSHITNSTETAAGLLTAGATAAVVPSNIAKIASEILVNEADARSKSKDQSVIDTNKQLNESKATTGFILTPVTIGWWRDVTKIKEGLLSLETEDIGPISKIKKELIKELGSWADSIAKDKDLNFKSSEPNQVKRHMLFRSAAAKYHSLLLQIYKNYTQFAEFICCKECQLSEKSCKKVCLWDKVLQAISKDLGQYLPTPPASPGFELYEIQYEKDGTFKGLVKRFP
jgi:hypothetical protein